MTIEGRPSAKTPLLFAGASTRPIEAWTQPASWKIRGNEKHAYFHKSWWKIKGERLSYLRIYLLYIVFLYIFLKKILALCARSIAFYPPLRNASMQCDFTSSIYIFFHFGVIIPYYQLQGFTENTRKISGGGRGRGGIRPGGTFQGAAF